MGVTDVFKKNFSALLEQAKWTQREFGERAGLTQAQASAYLRGENQPTLEILARIASAFGIEPSELLRSGEPPKARLSSLADDVRTAIAEESRKAINLAKQELVPSASTPKAVPNLPPLEEELLMAFRRLAASQQKVLLNTAKKMHAQVSSSKSEKKSNAS